MDKYYFFFGLAFVSFGLGILITTLTSNIFNFFPYLNYGLAIAIILMGIAIMFVDS